MSYSNRETGGVLPFRFGWTAKWAETEIPLGLEPETWGVTKQWVVVKAPQGYIRPKQPKGKSKKKYSGRGGEMERRARACRAAGFCTLNFLSGVRCLGARCLSKSRRPVGVRLVLP